MADCMDTIKPYGSAHDLPSFVSMREQLRGLKALTLFVMREKRAEIAELERELRAMADRVDAFYERLGARHWVYTDWMSTTHIDAILEATSTPQETESRLVGLYQDPEVARLQLLRLGNVDGLRERFHLLERARQDYDEGRFDTCSMLLISVMDGFVNDFQADKRKGLAAREADDMVAWNSVAGHHLGLTNALKPFLKTIKKRVDAEVFELHRHGIVHGSVVHYNNIVVATKAWNLLFAIVDWSVATTQRAKEDAASPTPTLRETWHSLMQLGRRRRARDEFEPWVVERDHDFFEKDAVVTRTRLFIDAWQNKQWGRIVPMMPTQLIGTKGPGKAAEYTKSWFDSHDIADVEIDRIEYTQSSVAEVRGSATIDGATGRLRLRWVHYNNEGNLALNGDPGSWRLAVVAPKSYLVTDDEAGLR